VAGAAAAVALSFLVLGVWMRRLPDLRTYPRVNLLQFRLVRLLAQPVLLAAIRLVSVALYILLIVAGLFGTANPTRNIAPTLIWVIWWVGLAYFSAVLGNLWAVINPLAILYTWAEKIYCRVTPGRALSRYVPYPPALGVWPGVMLFLLFAWVEIVFDDAAVPSNLAVLTLLYSALTWLGMFMFGKDVWLRHGETFALVFALLSRFSLTEVRVLDTTVCQACHSTCRDLDGDCIDCSACFQRAAAGQREWNLRPLAVGLVRHETISLSQMAFVLVLLATVTFDGFMATPVWVEIERALRTAPPPIGGGNMTVVRTLGLLLFPIFFLELYVVMGFLMAIVSGKHLSALRLAQAFTFSLVPIAIAYHLAHYFSFLLIHGQRLIPLLSDPLGRGWDLFGTAAYRLNIGIVGARFAWYSAVLAIIIGHVIAVSLAHLIAMRLLRDRTLALRSQYPMLVLMVGYTIMSLWILAQPIVEGGEHEAAAASAPIPATLASPLTIMLVGRDVMQTELRHCSRGDTKGWLAPLAGVRAVFRLGTPPPHVPKRSGLPSQRSAGGTSPCLVKLRQINTASQIECDLHTSAGRVTRPPPRYCLGANSHPEG
jgi:hypothetical protein